jgi:hypothetical protein
MLRRTSALLLVSFATAVLAQTVVQESFEPVPGQPGKDVVWVPTPHALVEKMLAMAKVTPQDYVMDLGSGDGRNIIAAAKRGARAVGFEYNPDMVALSRRNAEKEGVADRAKFVQGDMFEADISEATVLALFLLPDNLRKLTPKFVDLRPGTRMVMNGFPIPGWDPDVTEMATGECGNWCTSHFYIVPAKVAGTWRLPQGTLTLVQNHQVVTGTLDKMAITNVQLRGDEISFMADGTQYEGRVNGDSIIGITKGNLAGRFTATKTRS